MTIKKMNYYADVSLIFVLGLVLGLALAALIGLNASVHHGYGGRVRSHFSKNYDGRYDKFLK